MTFKTTSEIPYFDYYLKSSNMNLPCLQNHKKKPQILNKKIIGVFIYLVFFIDNKYYQDPLKGHTLDNKYILIEILAKEILDNLNEI